MNLQVLAVTFESPARIRAFRERHDAHFPVLRDAGRRAYRAFGLARRPATTIWGPETLSYYARALLMRGELPGKARTDPYQLGGDVVLRPDRKGGWIYPSGSPADRPDVDSIIAVARRASAQSARSDESGNA